MAKKDNIVPFILLGAAAFLLFQQKPAPALPPRAPSEPPKPKPQPGQSATAIINALNAWVVAIVSLYGRSKWLFEPGGPFHGKSEEEINAILDLPPNAGWA